MTTRQPTGFVATDRERLTSTAHPVVVSKGQRAGGRDGDVHPISVRHLVCLVPRLQSSELEISEVRPSSCAARSGFSGGCHVGLRAIDGYRQPL